MISPQWLNWAQRLQGVAQTGLSYNPHVYDRERYEAVMQIAAEIMAAGSQADFNALLDVFAQQSGHATPKIDVRAAIFWDNQIMLVQEISDQNRWTLPGGWADIGESAAESVVREVHEETGYQVAARKLLALFDRAKHAHPPFAFYTYKAFFLCELLSDERALQSDNFETGDVGWFRRDALPELSTARVTHEQIMRFFEHHDNPKLATDFD